MAVVDREGMTLVLAVSTPAFALQVGDRLVSKDGRPHDALANKTVVARTTDGLLAIGYTGPAYLNRTPTDTWIAETVSNTPWDDGGMVAYGDFAVLDTGTTLLRLCRDLRAQRVFTQLAGELTAVGWQWNGRRTRSLVRNVLWLLGRSTGRLRWTQLVPRHLPERKTGFRMYALGDWPLGADRWTALLTRVGGAGSDSDAVETLLVEAIRDAHELRPGTIGPHCMSILLRPWLNPSVEVRFCPQSPHTGRAFGQDVELAFTPWLVAPDALHAPSVLVGGMSCADGLLPYVLRAPPTPDDQILKGALQSQARKRK